LVSSSVSIESTSYQEQGAKKTRSTHPGEKRVLAVGRHNARVIDKNVQPAVLCLDEFSNILACGNARVVGLDAIDGCLRAQLTQLGDGGLDTLLVTARDDKLYAGERLDDGFA
jgi:hypothetical protein